jgi:hypothetical protein
VSSKKSRSKGAAKKETDGNKAAQDRKAAPKRRQMTLKKYRILRKDYLEYQSIKHAAIEADVSENTARRYIVEGRPDKNMPAIIDLARVTAKKDEAKIEFTLDEFRRRYIKEIKEALDGAIVEIRLHNRRTQKEAMKVQSDKDRMPEVGSKWLETIKGYDMLVRLAERALGGADETVNLTSVGDFTSKMNAEEAIEYLKTGVIPEHLR